MSNSKNTTTPANSQQEKSEDFATKQTLSGLLGEVIWLMQQSPHHRQVFIAELDWLVTQPILLNQYRIYRKDQRPVGVVFWAKVDDDVHKRLQDGYPKLRSKEWNSGENYWIVDVLAPFGNAEYFVEDTGKALFADKTYHYSQFRDGKLSVITVEKQRNV